MSREDIALDEKRIYGETRQTTVAYVASETGVARVELSGDQVGRIGLVDTAPARDVAGAAGRLLVAGHEDVRVGTDADVTATGFGPAAAVGVTTDRLLAAGLDGRIAALEGSDWRTVGRVEAPRRFDGAYLAAGEGVFRVGDDGLEHLDLDDARDVAAAGPYAATGDRLCALADGTWRTARDGAAERVAARDGLLHVIAGDQLLERVDGDWRQCDLPVRERVADVAYGEATYAVTVDGTFVVDTDPETTPDGTGGWRHRALGVSGASTIAVP